MVERKWKVLTNTTIGAFMALLDSSIVLVSLPTIGRELSGTTPETLLWVVLSYSLVTTTLLVSFGRLSDMFGRVRLYTLGFAVFTIGSLFCSLAWNGDALLGARVVEGVGAGFLSSNAGAILTDSFPLHERGRALGINQVAGIAGSMMGLVLGGVLTSTLGWRSIFWVNIPIGIVGTMWAWIGLKETHAPEVKSKVDWVGNTLFGAGLTSILGGVTLGALLGWTDPIILALLISGPAAIVFFVLVELKVTFPMFDLHLFRIRTFVMGNTASLLSALARGCFSFMMVFYFQGILFKSAFEAGLLLLPLSIAFIVVGPISGAISDKLGAKFLGTTGLLLSATGFLILLQFPAYGPYDYLATAMVLLGIGQGMFAAPNRAEVMSSVPPERRGVSSAVSMTFLNAGNMASLALGFSIMAGLIPRATLLAVFSGESVSTPIDVGGFMSALHILFAVSFVLTILAALSNALRGHEARH